MIISLPPYLQPISELMPDPSVREAKPSALQDFEAGRRCEIDAINGAVPVEAARLGMEARTNQVVADIVRAKQSLF